MTYPEVLDFMFQSLPMYHRLGAAAYKADLCNTESLMEFLNHPERDLRCIHVAGTNGKGSVSHLTAALLQAAGFKVGLYTSPHLVDFRERIRIGGQMIPENEVVDFITHLKNHFDLTAHPLSFFEMTVGLAFHYFQKEHVDYAVVEVGLGGRLDSTNVIQPLLSVITNIGLEHTQFLGDTLPKIAAEKAGIIKPNAPVIIGETQPETQPVFDARAKQCQVPIVYADQHYAIHDNGSNSDLLQFSIHDLQSNNTIDDCQCPLAGSYQFKNIITFTQVAHATTQFIDYSHQPLSINQLIH
ncbi:MAG: bifunctional folylpolyglutamate synthase/dihydrofolate synthase, partial [Bacteroidales bacterium]|nr:bifunctional folylpolyglutamate synthase/dihydrofolate synthase [Candidatus Colimorpha onthohippi]